MVRDPVCGMQINETEAKHILEYEGRTFYFCSEGCKREFQRHIEDYVDSAITGPGGDEDV